MRKIGLIIKREYLSRVKKKSFILTTLLVPIGFLLLFAVQFILIAFNSDTLRIVVKDDTGNFAHRIKDTETLYFKKSNETLEQLQSNYIEQGYDGVLYIPQLNLDNPNGITYFSDKLLGLSAKSYIQNELKDELRKLKLAELGVNDEVYNRVQKIQVNVSEKASGGSTGNTGLATAVGFIMGFLMYMIIFIYGAMVMRGVMEEKTNRIVEVLLSSVRPFQLMIGKIVGIGAVGLTQFVIWVVLMFLINLGLGFLVGGSVGGMSGTFGSGGGIGGNEQQMEQAMQIAQSIQEQISNLPVGMLVIGFIFYFLFGYIMYAALFAAVGSAVNDESETQSLTFPVSLPIIISIFILSAVMESPNSGLAFWSSLIPLFSPIIMPFRIAFGVPVWELLLSMVLLIAGSLAMVWLSAKIYRTGILLYGKKVTLSEIARWMVRSAT
ncbi:MAG: ABC transporter permease [Sphingobacteriales bacterium]|nr:MAG: ABC transporter permease [Sphingobacteriales bacterium]